MEMRNPAFLEQRAIALATVLLTRHPKAVVAPITRDCGYDLDVNIATNGRLSGRVFGVELKARTSMEGIGKPADGARMRLRPELSKALAKSAQMMRDLPFPLLFMAFAMASDRAFFGWIREPSTSRRLKSPPIVFANEWMSDTHMNVIGTIERWYESLEQPPV